nr:MAG TPA: hypothetical protein [Bacteriophage sp.]
MDKGPYGPRACVLLPVDAHGSGHMGDDPENRRRPAG